MIFSMSVTLLWIFFIKEVLEWLRKRVIRVRPDIADKWMLYHDNAPCHTALSVAIFDLKRHSCGSPAPSPDLNPCDFLLFSKLKSVLNGRDFVTLENVQKSVTDMLKTTRVEDFQRCHQKWEQRLHRCVAVQGNYFEGDNIVV